MKETQKPGFGFETDVKARRFDQKPGFYFETDGESPKF